MKRRKALLGILGVGGAAASLGGYKWHSWNRKPSIQLVANKENLLGELANIIIPATDSPGAMQAGAGRTIINLIVNCTERRTQNRFIEGLVDLEERCQDLFDRPFEKCSHKEKVNIIKYYADQGKRPAGLIGKAMNKIMGKTFFQTLKEYTALSYYTSEIGASQALSYIHIPGRYDGCIPLKEGQKCWAVE